ncbi:hypothetical protein ULMS_01730 [Patiriisocius marinistellae]|uniref:Uncharacterized protein n=1 Tax=Patiriisocius marinistellae TaxID=2494560 RepID=A0A5J4FX99_9FLAO|nr:hypothetical protein [Patiriisocius marinistellae]GEQ84665.1 hypothetical protein ULMS_01730 [Patiriisocius marinistellae]
MIIRTLILTLCISITACCTSKKSTTDANMDSTEKSEIMMTDAKMMEAGFKQGVIVASNIEGDCPFTIKIDGDQPYFLDPINLDDMYKKDGMKIWFTFNGLRMMNRCEKANPVNVNEIQVRK